MKKFTGCLLVLVLISACLFVLVAAYFVAPGRTNVLILGIDGGLGRGDLGRTDTIIVATVDPFKPYVGLLSIPRDLWVPIEGVGENRINTAYFFAEANEPGSGPNAAMKVVTQNFEIPLNQYLILRMDGLVELVNSMGGVDIVLESETGGFTAGSHHLDGEQALKFARSRANADDFSRMAQGQVLIKAVLRRLTQPDVWPKIPKIVESTQAIVNMDIQVWLLPRLAFAILRAGQENIDSRTITREMVRPFTTNQGAQVLEPDWDAILGLVREMFGK